MKKEFLVVFIIAIVFSLISNNTVNAKAQDIGITKIQFGDFVPEKDYRWFRINNAVESSSGTIYSSNTIVVDASLNAYAEYEMNGNFSLLTGKLTTGKTYDDTVSGNGISGGLTIIGDGKELYRCDGITKDAGEIYFSVDVTGIKKMTITTSNSGKWSYGFFYIVDSYLYSDYNITGESKIQNFKDIYTNDATSYNGHFYKVYYTSRDWEDAKKCCIERGGYLASISSEEEDAFLYNLIRNAEIDGAWFGLSYNYYTQTWNWESGECVEYTNWAPDEPNYQGKTEKYGMYYSKYDNGQWNDGNGEAGAYICEWGDVPQLASDNLKEVRNTASTIKKGDVITFGAYEQDNDLTNGKEPIEWIVLSIENGNAVLFSKYVLDYKTYREGDKYNMWEFSTLRGWLNKDFYDTSFSDKEKRTIIKTNNLNLENPVYGSNDGDETIDNIFLLSLDEITNTEYGFSENYDENDMARRSSATIYAVSQGAYNATTDYDKKYMTIDGEPCCGYGLRSPGMGITGLTFVSIGGAVQMAGGNGNIGVRPALKINIDLYMSSDIISDDSNAENDVKVGDIITFGSYEQDNNLTNGTEPIEWIIMDIKNNKALLLSKYGLDCKQYNSEFSDTSWENCTLRSWLNKDFYNTAFLSSDKQKICETNVRNYDNVKYNTDGGNDTIDRIFLLSLAEINYLGYGFDTDYYENDISRRCGATAYAIANGAYMYYNSKDAYTIDGIPTSNWWLRSPGFNKKCASFVGANGHRDDCGADYCYLVRPAIWIDLDKYGLHDELGTDDDSFSLDRKTLGIFRPKLSVKNVKNKSEVILTIGKAPYAEGYVVYMKKKGDRKYKKIKTISKDGSKERKVTIDNLNNGTYFIKVKAYHKSGDMTEWSAGSTAKCSISTEMVKNSKLNLKFDDGERKTVNMKLKWGWSVLEKSSNTSYNHNLAKIALLMSQDVYDRDSIYERYAELGFELESIKYTKSFSGNNFLKPGIAFASRKIMDDDGIEKSIIAVSVQGTNSFDTLLTDICDGGLKGFKTSGEYAIKQLKAYAKQMEINLNSKNTILFVTGHSLGGAVSGRLAVELKALNSKAKIFVYTFASAKYEIDSNEYPYVFNLVNRNDLITYVPKWNSRVGIDMYYDANASKYVSNRELIWGLKADEGKFEIFYDHYLATYLYCILTEKPSAIAMDYNYGKIPPSVADLFLIG